jgi:cell division septation protein DedD
VAQTQDEGFHEIQLNGKQLVFLFMAATVVSVVIFLCGVLVGRGVRAERSTIAEAPPINNVAETTPQQPAAAPAPVPTPAGSDPRAASPPPVADDLTYFNRLEKQKAPQEVLKPSPEKQVAPPAPPPTAAPSREAPRSAAVDAATAEPPGSGFAVQIAALNVRGEAEAIAKRLSSKGYAAYVVSPATGTAAVYRVRVGKFTSRREAESVAAKLKKEEQFNPWVTR